MEWDLLGSAGLAGLAVVAVTLVAGRMGGVIGGLLATAPVTSAAALVFLALESGNAVVGGQMLAGGKSLFAALMCMPAFFFVLKWTRGAPLALRLFTGLATFVVGFTGMTLAVHAITPTAWSPIWLLASLVTAGLFGLTFLQLELPLMQQRAPRMGLKASEIILRFAAGAGVVLLVGWLRTTMPGLSTAWAVFPGTFLVSLWILGIERGAAFSAKASQGGVMGIPPLVAYMVVLWAVLPLNGSVTWTWLSQVPAWLAYFAVMVPIAKWREGTTAQPGVPA